MRWKVEGAVKAMRILAALTVLLLSGSGSLAPGVALADLPEEREVALVVQLRGKALVERGEQQAFEAFIKSPIERNDIVETLRKSRAKMLFRDESIMTLGPESRASVKEFTEGMEGRKGATKLNLLSGKMRTVVGKSSFEVHTPTVVAAARGTIIEFTVAVVGGKTVTVVSCLEGTVELSSNDGSVRGVLLLKEGQTAVLYEGQDPSTIEPVPTAGYTGLPGSATVVTAIETEAIDAILTPSVIITPPVEIVPEVTATPVIVDVIFPDGPAH